MRICVGAEVRCRADIRPHGGADTGMRKWPSVADFAWPTASHPHGVQRIFLVPELFVSLCLDGSLCADLDELIRPWGWCGRGHGELGAVCL